jgi:transposase
MNEHTAAPPHDWKEYRRLRAWELAQAGRKPCEIATILGVTDGAVSQWLTRARADGVDALRHRASPGRPPKLPPEQRAHLPALLAQGAEAFGFRGDLWTTPRIADLIHRQFGVRYHPAHVSRLLRHIGWSPQQPEERATQRDEEAIAAWLTERWPALKKKPTSRDGPSSG